MLVRLALAIVRQWTSLYTLGMPPDVRDERRAEINSDLWECEHEKAAAPTLPLQIITRLAAGLWDDVAWRWECLSPFRRVSGRAMIALAAAGAAVFAVVWIGPALRAGTPPPVPPRPIWPTHEKPLPPPPPPPPPPCAPAGVERGDRIC